MAAVSGMLSAWEGRGFTFSLILPEELHFAAAGLERIIGSNPNPNAPATPEMEELQNRYNRAAIQVAFVAGCLYTGVGLLRMGERPAHLSQAMFPGASSHCLLPDAAPHFRTASSCVRTCRLGHKLPVSRASQRVHDRCCGTHRPLPGLCCSTLPGVGSGRGGLVWQVVPLRSEAGLRANWQHSTQLLLLILIPRRGWPFTEWHVDDSGPVLF